MDCTIVCSNGGSVANCTSCTCDNANGYFGGPTCSVCVLRCGQGQPDSTCNVCNCYAGYGGDHCDLSSVCYTMRLNIILSTIGNQAQFIAAFANDIATALRIKVNRVVNIVLRASGSYTMVDFCLNADNSTAASSYAPDLEEQLVTPNSTLSMGDTTVYADPTYGVVEGGGGSSPSAGFLVSPTVIGIVVAVFLVVLIGVLVFVAHRQQWCCFGNKRSDKARLSFQDANAHASSTNPAMYNPRSFPPVQPQTAL